VIASATASPQPTFTSKTFGVTVVPMPVGDDQEPARIANYLRSNLAEAWGIATSGKSVMTLGPDVLIVVDSSMNPRQPGWGISAPQRLLVIHQLEGATMDVYLKVVVHEMGHVLGCCHGAGSDGNHVAGCPAAEWLFPANSAIMCPNGGDARVFSPYELAQLGL